jgi:hypothetical protein
MRVLAGKVLGVPHVDLHDDWRNHAAALREADLDRITRPQFFLTIGVVLQPPTTARDGDEKARDNRIGAPLIWSRALQATVPPVSTLHKLKLEVRFRYP